MIGFIYIITNTINGKQYVGQTRWSLRHRYAGHVADSKKKGSSPIHRAIRKYGQASFTIAPLLIVRSERAVEWLNLFEPLFIQRMQTLKPYGYNLHLGGDARSVHAETRAKSSAARKGKKNAAPRSEEYRAKVRLKHTGAKRSPEACARMSAAQQRIKLQRKGKKFAGHPHSEETRKLLSERGKGRIVSPETRAKLSVANKGRPGPMTGKHHSEELKARWSAAKRGIPKSPETIAKRLATLAKNRLQMRLPNV